MTTDILLMAAVAVFLLMVIGLILTLREFTESTDEPWLRKDARAGAATTPHKLETTDPAESH